MVITNDKGKMQYEYRNRLRKNSLQLVVIMTITAFITTFFEFCGPLVIKNFLDNYDPKGLLKSLLIIITVYLLAFLTKLATSKFKNWYSVKFKSNEMLKLFNIMFSMGYEELTTLEPTYLVEKINTSVHTLYTLYSEAISNFCVAVATIGISIILMLKTNWVIALIFCLLIPLQIIGYKKLNLKLSNLCMSLQTICAKSFTKILSITSNIDYIKGRSDYGNVLNILSDPVKTINNENAKVNKYAEYVSIVLDDLITLLSNAIYIYSAIMLFMKNITLSDFVFISLISSLYFPALSKIVRTNLNTRDLKGVYEFIENEMLSKVEEDGSKPFNSSIQDIDFQIKNFGIKNTLLIEDGEFHAKKGDIVFVSSPSGSGKSSLMKGIMKFFKANIIKINGIPIEDIKNKSLRSKISYYSQNIPLINATIRDNILMGEKNTPKKQKIIDNIFFLQKFKSQQEGLDTLILENGANLSGGDKQKIALSRIYLDAADVIILDEVTNSIDEETSKEIIGEIVKSFKDKIIFIVSHDEFLQQYCNKKMVISDKKLIEVSI